MSIETKGGSDLFLEYLTSYKDEVKPESMEGYYHANVVAEAYNQGFADGEASGKKDFIGQLIKEQLDLFTKKANQVYILSHNVISFLKENGHGIESMHINLNPICPRVILSASSELLVDDEFINLAYGKIIENKKIFSQLFPEILDIGIVASDSLDKDLLKEDGYGYSEEY